ncbi:unnamed protein product [Nezara viridula]|uniref:Uncharacterized protein n=1 Tax=Nezara viridula TaxID=85310 RepID=A0A9P0DYU3_NEZVI|nr:unnamed protein product [Nezara viridula]
MCLPYGEAEDKQRGHLRPLSLTFIGKGNVALHDYRYDLVAVPFGIYDRPSRGRSLCKIFNTASRQFAFMPINDFKPYNLDPAPNPK